LTSLLLIPFVRYFTVDAAGMISSSSGSCFGCDSILLTRRERRDMCMIFGSFLLICETVGRNKGMVWYMHHYLMMPRSCIYYTYGLLWCHIAVCIYHIYRNMAS